MSEAKTCSRCRESKTKESFYQHKTKIDGLNSWCKECYKEYRRACYLKNRDQELRRNKDWRQRNPKKARKFSRERLQKWRLKNLEKAREYSRRWWQQNREKQLEYHKEYRQRNPEKRRAYHAKRRALKKQCMPAWADLEKIKKIYEDAGPGYHVDHIVPLQGKNVCGLHVENNLQIIPAKQNLEKSNKFDQELENLIAASELSCFKKRSLTST